MHTAHRPPRTDSRTDVVRRRHRRPCPPTLSTQPQSRWPPEPAATPDSHPAWPPRVQGGRGGEMMHRALTARTDAISSVVGRDGRRRRQSDGSRGWTTPLAEGGAERPLQSSLSTKKGLSIGQRKCTPMANRRFLCPSTLRTVPDAARPACHGHRRHPAEQTGGGGHAK